MGRIIVSGILITLLSGRFQAAPPAAETVSLQSAIDTAPAGTADGGHAFVHVVDLNPSITYTGGARDLEA